MSDGILKFKKATGQQTEAQICAKIDKIDIIIDAFYDSALISGGNASVSEIEIDTGQTKQKVKYSGVSSVPLAIERYETLRQKLLNKLSPRMIRLMDAKNMRR